MMPEMDGFDAGRADPAGPELAGDGRHDALVRRPRRATPRAAATLGIAAYLTKPVKQSELLDAILAALGAPAAATGRAAAPPPDAAARPARPAPGPAGRGQPGQPEGRRRHAPGGAGPRGRRRRRRPARRSTALDAASRSTWS